MRTATGIVWVAKASSNLRLVAPLPREFLIHRCRTDEIEESGLIVHTATAEEVRAEVQR